MLGTQSKLQAQKISKPVCKVTVFFKFDFNLIRLELQIQKTATVRSLISRALTTISFKLLDIQIEEGSYEMFAAKKCGKKTDLPALWKEQAVGGTKLTHFYLQHMDKNSVCSTLYSSNTCLVSEMRAQKYHQKEVISPLKKRYACC